MAYMYEVLLLVCAVVHCHAGHLNRVLSKLYGMEQSIHQEVIEQWVEKVTKFSSQYDTDEWSAQRLCGPPAVYPRYGDLPGAWATEHIDDKQFVEVQFKEEVYVFGIEVYEVYHAGGTRKISALNPDKEWVTLWKTKKVEDIKKSRKFIPPLKDKDFKTNCIRLEIDCSKAKTWVEIDAIKLKGTKEYDPDAAEKAKEMKKKAKKEAKKGLREQWVDKVKKFSSQYDKSGWAANNLRGKPNVYPQYGDAEGAWATSDIDAEQFAVVEFKKKVHVAGIAIYEVFHAGGVSRVSLLSPDDTWLTVWTSPKVEDIEKSRIFSPPLEETDFKTKTVRIDIDCSVAKTYVEIDAIKLIGRKEDSSDSESSESDSDSDSDDGEKKKDRKKKEKKNSSACVVL